VTTPRALLFLKKLNKQESENSPWLGSIVLVEKLDDLFFSAKGQRDSNRARTIENKEIFR
jgi:hypothetical protein